MFIKGQNLWNKTKAYSGICFLGNDAPIARSPSRVNGWLIRQISTDSSGSRNLPGNTSLDVNKEPRHGRLKSIRKCSADARFREPKLMHGPASSEAHCFFIMCRISPFWGTETGALDKRTIGLMVSMHIAVTHPLHKSCRWRRKRGGAVAAIGRESLATRSST